MFEWGFTVLDLAMMFNILPGERCINWYPHDQVWHFHNRTFADGNHKQGGHCPGDSSSSNSDHRSPGQQIINFNDCK